MKVLLEGSFVVVLLLEVVGVGVLGTCLLRPSAGKVDKVNELGGGQEHEPSGESTP